MKKKLYMYGGGAAIIVLLLIGILNLGGSEDISANLVYASVERGPMVVDILEAASIESSDSQIVKSGVEGQTTIISIIPEGTILTQEDVANERVLIELDSASLRERKTQQEITVQSELASYTDAKESFEIQKNENESNLNAGKLKIKFTLMDLQKYLGEQTAQEFVKGDVTLENLALSEHMSGDALLEFKTRQNNIDLANEDLKRAEVKLGWTEKLLEKGYKTRDEFEADQLSLKRLKVDLEKRESELDLYKRYEFPKQAEQLRSNYIEAERELERIEARNRAQLSKAESRLKSNEATYKQQVERLDKINEQLANCIIKATKPGMVVYANSDDWRGNEPIMEGTTVRERQELIKIPNATTMVAKARIHESVITSVKPGLPAEVTIDALPGRKFSGEVQKVALLPDAQNRWMNPNLKVYTTEVLIKDEGNNGLKPGMSANVRIIINSFDDVIKVPVQAVTAEGKDRIVFVDSGSKPQKRVVEVGDYNDKFMQIKTGLKQGERVVMNPNILMDNTRQRITPDRGVPEQTVAQNPEQAADSQAPVAGEQMSRSVPGGGEAPAAGAGNSQMRPNRQPREGGGQQGTTPRQPREGGGQRQGPRSGGQQSGSAPSGGSSSSTQAPSTGQ